VQAVTLAEIADELYALPPAQFVAARDERARAARVSGQREDAAEIRKLARPTTSAWLVNQLSRDAAAPLGRLLTLGEALQQAQRTLAGDRLRELSVQRRQVVGDLLSVAAALAGQAGQPASQAVLDEVRATLEAALADEGARDAVRSGRLTKALAYAGLGEVDLTAALALPPERGPAARGGARRAAAPAAERPREPGDAAQARAAAESAVAAAAAAVAAADGDLAAIAEQRQFLRRRISHLQSELAQANAEDTRLGQDAAQAEQARNAAAREQRAAQRQLDRVKRQSQR
jgi:hypothetical protein